MPFNSVQLRIDDCKLSTIDTTNTNNMDNTNNTDNESETWFWNESANETDSDTEEEEGNNNHENDLEEDESKIEEAASSEIHKFEIKWNREGEEKLCGVYRKKLRRTQMRKQKSAWELEKKAFQTYYSGTVVTK